MRDQRLDHQRRAAETSDDDLIPFGDRPTVSRFGAISRTSKTMYQGAGPLQGMAPQGAPTKSMNMSGKTLRGELLWRAHIGDPQHHPYHPLTVTAIRNRPRQPPSGSSMDLSLEKGHCTPRNSGHRPKLNVCVKIASLSIAPLLFIKIIHYHFFKM